jgi:hypothetical protein
MYLPKPAHIENEQNNIIKTNRGCARDRMLNRLVTQATQESIILSQMFEEAEGNISSINATVLARVGLNTVPIDNTRNQVLYSRITTAPKKNLVNLIIIMMIIIILIK